MIPKYYAIFIYKGNKIHHVVNAFEIEHIDLSDEGKRLVDVLVCFRSGGDLALDKNQVTKFMEDYTKFTNVTRKLFDRMMEEFDTDAGI